MLIGITPLMLAVSWIAAIIASVSQHRGQMGGSDAFLMIAAGGFAYLFAIIIAAPSAIWTILLFRRNPELRSRSVFALSTLICAILAIPLVWYFSIQLHVM
jgi:hypothetical protein